MTWFETPRANYLKLLSRNGMGIEADIPCVRVLAQHQESSAVAAIVQTLIHRIRMPYTLYYDVGAIAAGFGQHLPLPLFDAQQTLRRS